jgi:hypothetical protein
MGQQPKTAFGFLPLRDITDAPPGAHKSAVLDGPGDAVHDLQDGPRDRCEKSFVVRKSVRGTHKRFNGGYIARAIGPEKSRGRGPYQLTGMRAAAQSSEGEVALRDIGTFKDQTGLLCGRKVRRDGLQELKPPDPFIAVLHERPVSFFTLAEPFLRLLPLRDIS